YYRTKHLNVAEATKKYQIISVAGELTGSDKLSKNKKAKYEELEKLAEKFNFIANKKQTNPRKEDANYDPQEESSSRAKSDTVLKEKPQTETQDETQDTNVMNQAQTNKNSTRHLHT
ncbi:873_t:CDS:2, partial [Gigaspora rosea]